MPRNAVVGAKYKDTTFGMECEIVSVEAPEMDAIPDDSEITVSIEYEDGSVVPVSLESFRKSSGMRIIGYPNSG